MALRSSQKWPISDITTGLPTLRDDDQARYLEAVIRLPDEAIRVASVYLPNGNPADGPKYDYKLDWLAALQEHARTLLTYEETLVLGGDYNVIPDEADCYNPAVWREDALFKIETRERFRRMLSLGLSDAFRLCNADAGEYSFWDYQAGAWQKNLGIRIDHLLLSPEAADRLQQSGIDKHVRGREKPSDHVPAWAILN